MPHPELTLERRIDAELCGLDAKMCVYADDLHGHVVGSVGLMMNLNRHPRSRFIFSGLSVRPGGSRQSQPGCRTDL